MDRPQVLLEDDHLLVLNKPAGWLVAEVDRDRTVLAWARQRALSMSADPQALHLVHRLDRDTSGCIVLAKSLEDAQKLGATFSDRRVYKSYVALTFPVPAVRWAEVEHLLRARRIEGGEKMEVVEQHGVLAQSEVEVLARGRRYGFVRVLPKQGRKHHIRVALADMGAPIIGDFLYGGRFVARQAKRVMLHARSLEFAHPHGLGHIRVHAPLARDLVTLFQQDGGLVPSALDRRHRRNRPKRKGPQGSDKRRR